MRKIFATCVMAGIVAGLVYAAGDDALTSRVIALTEPVATGYTYTDFEMQMRGEDIVNTLKSVDVYGNEEFQYKGKIRFIRSDGKRIQDPTVQDQIKTVNITHANLTNAANYYDPALAWPATNVVERHCVIARAWYTKMAKAKTTANVNLIDPTNRVAWVDLQMEPWEE